MDRLFLFCYLPKEKDKKFFSIMFAILEASQEESSRFVLW